ncbi:uncharacterized protein KGF55_001781 [Candida pseudojiufengensis]|uniref:uncharacterized protein n=1 Tax=Candida pseudojiufengensis TaxID=497109 RepID=UPI002224172E|nr:uncharacterized protein KGF55_001781 [Candida pseudojiufengensis]KAI5964712.1 hypothetical protein KGF55_001781 [Candida pseudojiufengensis]
MSSDLRKTTKEQGMFIQKIKIDTKIPNANSFQDHKSFESILPDLFKVYEQTNAAILQENAIPTKIRDFKDYTSIKSKYENNEYASSPYKLYNDIKEVSSNLINKDNIGSKEYTEIDFFYKFATELLLREVGNIVESYSSQEIIKNDLESQLEEDFNQILNSYTLDNGEIITFISKSEEIDQNVQSSIYNPHHPPPIKQKIQPLFSSIIKKSSLDNKPTFVNEPFSISKITPSIKDIKTNSLLESVSQPSPALYSPLNETPQILAGYFHPTWYTVAMPTWLNHKALQLKSKQLDVSSNLPQLSIFNQNQQDQMMSLNSSSRNLPTIWGSGEIYRSFAPHVDSSSTAVTDRLRSTIWLNHIGKETIARLKKRFINRVSGKSAIPLPASESEDVQMKELETEEHNNKDVGFRDVESQSTEIDLSKIYKWDPLEMENLRFLKAHEKDIRSPSKLQKLISDNLLKLNALRQDRYHRSDPRNPLSPNDEEKQLHNRLQRLFIVAIKLYKIQPSDFKSKISNKLPVLVSEYAGSLPGIPNSSAINGSLVQTNNIAKPSSRLQGLRTPSAKGGKRINFRQ